MAKSFKSLIAFIPLGFELMRQMRRNSNHDSDIRKKDKTAEKISTVEHLLVRLEKKVQNNREVFQKTANKIYLWLAINSTLLILVLLKLFEVL